ncbi:MAG TPA: FAD-linked oxidase C-terminal domain-containing protein, partial [Stenomitos sp.]
LPAALEMMDRMIIQAVEASFQFGFPTDAEAVLIVELDGHEAGLERQAAQTVAILQAQGAREVRLAKDDQERSRLWMARKKAVGCVGRLAPSKVTQDGVIPRSQLPGILRAIASIGARYGLRIANVFHAGDGNLHPIVLFDERDPEQVRKVVAAGQEILEACLAVGGSITGEHGIGVEKIGMMDRMFSPSDLAVMGHLRDAFNPEGLCNPGKLLPVARTCVESRKRP